jgi:hypothetical protein
VSGRDDMDFIRVWGLLGISVRYIRFVMSLCAWDVPRSKSLRGDAGLESIAEEDAQCRKKACDRRNHDSKGSELRYIAQET